MNLIRYIWHDCFIVKTGGVAIVFDYWKEEDGADTGLPGFLDGLDPATPLYVFVSHHHKDHYTRRIWEWSNRLANIRYIVSKDTAKYARHIITPGSVYTGPRPNEGSVSVLKEGETWSDGIIKVRAYGSTDIGNSYAVEAGGRIWFHAGDLNAWIWKEESTAAEVKASIAAFERIVDDICSQYPVIDVAMFPVDSRIGSEWYTGASIFVRKLDVRHFIPMHFGLGENREESKRYSKDAAAFELYANPERGEYIALQTPGAAFAF